MSHGTINKRLKERRLELGYTLDELAQITGYAKTTLHRYENDDNSSLRVDKIVHLAECLNVSPNYLLGTESLELTTNDFEFLSYITDLIPLAISYDEKSNNYFIFPEEVLSNDEYFWDHIKIIEDENIEKIFLSSKEMKKIKNNLVSFGKFLFLELLKNKKSTLNNDFETFYKGNKINLIHNSQPSNED